MSNKKRKTSSDAVTERNLLFVERFCTHFNAAKAYKEAGYKTKNPDVGSSKLLAKTSIQRVVRERLDSQISDLQTSREEVAREMHRIAFADLFDLVQESDGELALKPVEEIKPETRGATKTLTFSKKTTVREDGSASVSQNVSVSMHNKIDALKWFGKMYGMTKDWDESVAGLRKYGVNVVRDESTDVGYRLERM